MFTMCDHQILYINNCFNQSLHDKRVLALDLSAIVAGSGIRGQFEEKFKALLRDIEDQVIQLQLHLRDQLRGVCFIEWQSHLFY